VLTAKTCLSREKTHAPEFGNISYKRLRPALAVIVAWVFHRLGKLGRVAAGVGRGRRLLPAVSIGFCPGRKGQVPQIALVLGLQLLAVHRPTTRAFQQENKRNLPETNLQPHLTGRFSHRRATLLAVRLIKDDRNNTDGLPGGDTLTRATATLRSPFHPARSSLERSGKLGKFIFSRNRQPQLFQRCAQ